MAKPRNPIVDRLVYVAVRFVVAILQNLPEPLRRPIPGMLAALMYRVDRRHREVARENLRLSLPERCADPDECDRMVRAMYRHCCQMLIDMIMLPRQLHQQNYKRWIDLAQLPPILDMLTRTNQPLIIVTGHFGNWEVASYVLGLSGYRSYAIARTLDNPYLERFFKNFRQRTGQTILAKKGDFDQITEVLQAGRVLCTVADQDAGARGQFVQFFGRPASTHKAVALMALEFDAPIMVIGTPRVNNAQSLYRIEVEAVLRPSDYAGRPDAIAAITQDYSSALERIIRRHPEQYFWLHRRWKHQPPVRKAKAVSVAA
ncbi:lysophospholipid acyltransferase family protein [Tuwongella immobilis]|uniref:Lipid A biosynthesis acyltransferase n=1 Tax=Tuwongella immobilis TaxID=692036 RepID=A0A6C2YNI5_9BACT|nr:lipid A biosynthesis acyltransferase [Tuwongella immobilis]VIP02937.1 lipid a biosynthesis acyltransferase : Lauroyl/myristoyl acyltransferase OS=Singulisphaera acidiphila (strain ATCC BAA-1392 / DSM 18658 / VKM B-2454 / MOB10) GN=Sinac_5778 PE=4 SV=1: Lip_A_acyltrans [Tuwongella immobilis]VTS02899.1 lipid a biosynthesis acyltransferase : Lauroyl/myristoyl acyltransferase OS=Singulisphaera acidiphila (strain ATCC BAA-1392 / DSM 18658 / VKM B-2454 / MOB10) GN=Sinac_5778 PE=4 SV=1: Lip_A_acyltra